MRRRACAVVLLGSVAAASGQVGGAVLLSGSAAAAEPGISWSWPLAGPRTVSRPFAPPPTRYAAGHRGADLPAAVAAPVLAAAAGRVSYAGQLSGRGVVVVVHGDLRTTYEPVAPTVAVGEQVAAGAEIGRLDAGHAGCPAAACLHWGLRRGEDYLDPVRAVDRGPARLLPLGDGGRADPGTGRVPEPGLAGGVVLTPGEAAGGPEAGAVRAPRLGVRPSSAPDAPGVAGGWSLRAVQAPVGLAALAALVFGMGLLARRRPGPDDPAGSSAGAAPGSGSGAGTAGEPAGPDALVLQLDAERLRRRAG